MSGEGALRLLLAEAVAALNRNELVKAESTLREILSRAPGHAAALYLTGMLLAGRQDWPTAENILRRAQAADPAQPRIRVLLAQVLRAQGRGSEAVSLLGKPASGDREAWLELARAQEESGAMEAATESYRHLLAQIDAGAAGERQPLQRALALTLKRQKRYGDALAVLEQADGDLRAERAAMLQHLGRFDEAIAAYQGVLADNPLNLDAHSHLNELLYRLKRDDAFLDSFDRAAAKAPDAPQIPLTKGRWLLKAGEHEAAHDAFLQALKIAPDDAAALAGLGRALEAMGKQGCSLSAHEKNARLHAENPDVLSDYAGALLRSGDAPAAQQRAEASLAIRPYDQSALSLLTLSYRAQSDEREFALNGYDTFIRVIDLEPPRGYSGMESFNADLRRYLNSLHGDAREYFSQTLRGGTRLFDEVFDNGHALVDLLRERIDDAVRHYALSLNSVANHPFTGRRRHGFSYSGSWSSRLSDCGHHVNHIHPKGWISSAYYVALPDVTADQDRKEGWIKFGEPSDEYGGVFSPRRFVQPRIGRLVLFPSYMWHGTVPFHSPDTRMTIAFDAVPR